MTAQSETLLEHNATLTQDIEGWKHTVELLRAKLANAETRFGEAIQCSEQLAAENAAKEKELAEMTARAETERPEDHVVACRKNIYDIQSSPCTCRSEFERLAAELEAESARRRQVETEREASEARVRELELHETEAIKSREKAAEEWKSKWEASEAGAAKLRETLEICKEQLEMCGHLSVDSEEDEKRECDYCTDAWDLTCDALSTSAGKELLEELERLRAVNGPGHSCTVLATRLNAVEAERDELRDRLKGLKVPPTKEAVHQAEMAVAVALVERDAARAELEEWKSGKRMYLQNDAYRQELEALRTKLKRAQTAAREVLEYWDGTPFANSDFDGSKLESLRAFLKETDENNAPKTEASKGKLFETVKKFPSGILVNGGPLGATCTTCGGDKWVASYFDPKLRSCPDCTKEKP